MDCDGQWLHRVGTTRNLFVGKRCISSVNWWQQLLPRVRCGNLLALQRRTCGERTRVPAQSVSATFHLSTHPCHLVSTLLLEGAHILEAHMPGRTYRGRNCRGAHAGAMPGGAHAGGASGHKPVLYIIAYADRADRALNVSLSLWPICGPVANRTGGSGPCMGVWRIYNQ
jgi:hypothetical protein